MPTLTERIKIDFQAQQVRLFDHRSQPVPEILIGKEYLSPEPQSPGTGPKWTMVQKMLSENLPFGTISRLNVINKLNPEQLADAT